MKHRLWSVSLILILLGAPQALFAQAFLASHNKAVVDSVMTTIDSRGRLVQIRSDSCLSDGSSRSWTYKYRFADSDTLTNYFFHTTLSDAVFDSSNALRTLGDAFVTLPWIDSDSALTLAEERGGAAFQAANRNCTISASLGQAVVPDGHPLWYILYDPHDSTVSKLEIGIDATDTTVATVPIAPQGRPSAFVLWQNYPNPFNPTTHIRFFLRQSGMVKLTVFNLLGQCVASIVSDLMPAGSHEVEWDASSQPTGTFICRLQIDNQVLSSRMMLLK